MSGRPSDLEVLRAMLKENERVQAEFPDGDWWRMECDALRAAIAALEADRLAALAPVTADATVTQRPFGRADAICALDNLREYVENMDNAVATLTQSMTPSREQGEGS